MKLDDDVLAVLSAMAFEDRQAVIIGQLDRKLYLRCDKALQALGGKWSKSKKAHVFPSDAEALVDQACIAGEVTTAQEQGFFPTPPALAERLVREANIEHQHRVLEPSAGDGAIALTMFASGADFIAACELDPQRRQTLAERMDALPPDAPRPTSFTIHGDFFEAHCLSLLPFDRIVMNPPFARTAGLDWIDHILRARLLLAPGGRLVCVAPASIRFRNDRRHRELRLRLTDDGATITDLPDGSFLPATGVRTVMIVWDRL